jgi:lysophospholipase L1-like esterase
LRCINLRRIEMADNFRHAQYREDGTQIDDPQKVIDLTPTAYNGYRTVLFGDSMTDTYETVNAAVPASYNSTTGILTLNIIGHQQAVGWYLVAWNRSNPATIKGWRVPVLSVVDVNNVTVNIGSGLPNVPTTGWLVRLESWRSAQAFVPWLQAISGQRFNIVRNAGQSGDTTADCLARINADCLSYAPQVVIMQMPGINDTSTGNGNLAEDVIAINQQTIINTIVSAGALLILLLTTPPASAEARTTLVNMAKVQRLNKRLRDFCATKAGVIVFDAYRRIVDPASNVGAALANYIRTSDNIHYSMRGGKYIADQLWAQISSAFPSDYSTLPVSMIDNFWASALTLTSVSRSNGVVTATISGGSPGMQIGESLKLVGGSEAFNEYVTLLSASATQITFRTAAGADGAITGTIRLGRSRNLVPNCLLTTASGGLTVAPITGTAAGNIRLENIVGAATVVGSVVARSDGYGNDQQLVITASAANDQVAISSDFTTYTTDLPLIVKAGRTYVGELSLSLVNVSGSNLSEIRLNLEFTIGGTTYQTYALNGYSDGAVLNSDATNLHLRTAPMLMPAGTPTAIKWRLVLRFSAAGTALTATVGRIRMEESE